MGALGKILILLGILLLLASPHLLKESYEPKEGLEAGRKIEAWIECKSYGNFIGDEIPYRIIVLYDTRKVKIKEISEPSFHPFRVRRVEKKIHQLSNSIRKLTQTYFLQGIEVEPGRLYSFPFIRITYLENGKEKRIWLSSKGIYFSRIIPTEEKWLKPLKPEGLAPAYQLKRSYLKICYYTLGGLLMIGGLIELLRKRKRRAKERELWLEELSQRLENLKKISDFSLLLHSFYQLLKFLQEKEKALKEKLSAWQTRLGEFYARDIDQEKVREEILKLIEELKAQIEGMKRKEVKK